MTPTEGMARLLSAAEHGDLDSLLAGHGVRVLTVFGSASRDEPDPQDLDVGVLFERGVDADALGLSAALARLSRTDVDLGVVDGSSAVFRERALAGATPVWESTPGAWIEASVAATLERMDTAAAQGGPRAPGPRVTPRRLDPEVVDARLRSIEPLLTRLEQLRDVTGSRLAEDLDLRLVVERTLTVLVDTAVSVNSRVVTASGRPSPADYRSTFLAAADVGLLTPGLAGRIAPSAGLRNLLTHRYGEVDQQRLAEAVPGAVEDYREYVAQVSRWLLDAGGSEGTSSSRSPASQD